MHVHFSSFVFAFKFGESVNGPVVELSWWHAFPIINDINGMV